MLADSQQPIFALLLLVKQDETAPQRPCSHQTQPGPLPFANACPMMELGQSRTALGCGNPFKPTCALGRTKIPYAFAVGEPATYVQAPKAKGRRNRAV